MNNTAIDTKDINDLFKEFDGDFFSIIHSASLGTIKNKYDYKTRDEAVTHINKLNEQDDTDFCMLLHMNYEDFCNRNSNGEIASVSEIFVNPNSRCLNSLDSLLQTLESPKC